MIGHLLASKGLGIQYKFGSALSKINQANENIVVEDLDTIASLYIKEANTFIEEMRNKVSPSIKLIDELITNNFNKVTVDIKSKYNLKIIGDVELFNYLEDNNKLEVIGNGALPKGALIGFPLDEETEIKNLFITGNESLDNIIFNTLNKYNETELRSIWNKYMLDFSGSNNLLNELEYLHFRNIDNIILIYAALENILNGKVRYTLNNNSFESNKINLSDFINFIIKKYNTFINAVKNTNLIVNYYFDPEDKKYDIYVTDNLYNEFIENHDFGVDAIFGFVVNNEKNNGNIKSATLEVLVNSGNLYVDIYKNNFKLDNLANSLKNVNNRKSILKTLIYPVIEILKNNCSTNLIVKMDLTKENELIEILNTISDEEVFNTMELSVKIVSLFNPQVKEFIDTMETQMKFLKDGENDDMAKEASLYAVIVRLINLLFKDVEFIKVN